MHDKQISDIAREEVRYVISQYNTARKDGSKATGRGAKKNGSVEMSQSVRRFSATRQPEQQERSTTRAAVPAMQPSCKAARARQLLQGNQDNASEDSDEHQAQKPLARHARGRNAEKKRRCETSQSVRKFSETRQPAPEERRTSKATSFARQPSRKAARPWQPQSSRPHSRR